MRSPLLFTTLLLALLYPALAGLPTLEWKDDLPEEAHDALISWRFEEGDDVVGYIKPARWTPAGKFGGGLEIDALRRPEVNENFAKANHEMGQFTTASITIDLWFKPSAASGGQEDEGGYLFDQMYVGDEGIQLFFSKERQLVAKVGNGAATLFTRSARLDLPAEEWVHIGLSYDAERGALTIYLDGMVIAEKVQPGFGPLASGSRSLRIGNRQGPLYQPLAGTYDNFRIVGYAASFQP